MVMPSEEKLRLHDIIRNGTEEVLEAYIEFEEIIQKNGRKKNNPSPWGDLML